MFISCNSLLVLHPPGLRFGTPECFRFNKDILGFFQLLYEARGGEMFCALGQTFFSGCGVIREIRKSSFPKLRLSYIRLGADESFNSLLVGHRVADPLHRAP